MPEPQPSVDRSSTGQHDLQATLRLLHACADGVVRTYLLLALVLVAAGGLLAGTVATLTFLPALSGWPKMPVPKRCRPS